MSRRVMLPAITIVLVLILGTAGYVIHLRTTASKTAGQPNNKAKTTSTSQTLSVQPLNEQTTLAAPSGSKDSHTLRPAPKFTLTSITLLPAPKQLGDLDFFNNFNSYFNSDTWAQNISYYKIGTDQSGRDVIDVEIQEDPVGPGSANFDELVALELSPKSYVILSASSHMVSNDVSALDQALNNFVTIDTSLSITELSFPSSLAVTSSSNRNITVHLTQADGLLTMPMRITPNGLAALNQSKPAVTFGTSGGITISELDESTNPLYRVLSWYGTIGNIFAVGYIPSDLFLSTASTSPSSSTVSVNWKSGQSNLSEYDAKVPGQGCSLTGGPYTALPLNFDTSTLTAVGTGPTGQTIYELPESSPLLNYYYSDLYDKGQTDDVSLQNLTLAQFQANHSVILVENNAKEYVIYTRADTFVPDGCGEPVIYLYPKQPSKVDVRVGAEVVKSAPTYPVKSGWQNVLAEPNGQLSYEGQAYSSLIWEGYGYGPYPAIHSGAIVPTFMAPMTIQEQLSEQGLSSSEIRDFLAFWSDKLPATPYTRLTWLTTAQMNALAPLAITPKPDTLIRVFLDFQGLNQPETLAPQHFTAPARNGFTVVEWGGLLRGGIK